MEDLLADDDRAILGLDNVPLDLPLAGIGSRTLAATIDYFVLTALLLLWIAGGSIALGLLGLGGGWVAAIVILGVFVIQWGYFAILEIAMDGRTLGKRWVGLRVVARHGGRPGTGALLARNFLRSVDIAVGLVVMAFDRRFRRLGDMVAGTLVVHDRSDDELRLGRLPASWGAREIAVVESFLRRADRMERPTAGRLAGQLLDWIRRSDPGFDLGSEAKDPVARLREVLQATTAPRRGNR